MNTREDLGFIAPESLPGAEPAEETPEPNPFQQLEEPAKEPDDEEGLDEVYQNLEEEYRILASLKRRRDELKTAHGEASADYEAHRGRMLRAMRSQGTRQFRSTTVERGSCNFSGVYSVKMVDREAFMAWAKQEAEELLTVNAQTLAKHVREKYRNKGVPPDSDDFPPGLEVKEYDTLTVNVPKET